MVIFEVVRSQAISNGKVDLEAIDCFDILQKLEMGGRDSVVILGHPVQIECLVVRYRGWLLLSVILAHQQALSSIAFVLPHPPLSELLPCDIDVAPDYSLIINAKEVLQSQSSLA